MQRLRLCYVKGLECVEVVVEAAAGSLGCCFLTQHLMLSLCCEAQSVWHAYLGCRSYS